MNHLWQKFAIVAFLVFSPFIAYANIFSFIAIPVRAESDRSAEDYNYNSQNIAVLGSDEMEIEDLAKGGGEITIVDDTALLASSGVSGTVILNEKPKNNGKISIYEVRDGDTLSQIADMFEVSVNTIRWANDFEGAIQPGQTLVILPVTGVTHTVKYGGTIQDIADIYDADVKEIALFNGIDVDVELAEGDEVIVPYIDPSFKEDHSDNNSSTEVKSYASASVNTSGYFINPVPGSVITQGLHGYNAVDLGAPHGTSIYAAAAGKVITSKQGGWNGGYGSMIVISHPNGTQTLYSHMSSNAAYVGQVVEQGELIGYVGSTGRSTGNHLHFEVRGATNPLAR